jgi:outer membrane protein assembly factor BamB
MRRALPASCAAAVLAAACSRHAGPAEPAPRWTVLAAAPATARALARPLAGPAVARSRVVWRFGAGSPVVGAPAVAVDGRVYVATAEGYLHALGPDGAFLWSYTLSGPVAAGPAVDAGGLVYVATARPRLHALGPEGRVRWSFRAPAVAVGDAGIDARGRVSFAARDRNLYVVGARGGGSWSTTTGALVTAGPVATSNELVVGTAQGRVLFVRGVVDKTRHALGAPIEGLTAAPDGSGVLVVAGGRLTALDPRRGVLWTAEGARLAPAVVAREIVVIGAGDELVWLGLNGAILRRAALGAAPSAPPALDAAGRAWVPTSRGRLLVFGPDGLPRAEVAVGALPLGRPVVDAARGQLLVTSGDAVAAVALEAPRS